MDCWKALRFHLHDKHKYKNQSIRSFSSLLSHELLHNKFSKHRIENDNMTLPGSLSGDRESDVSHHPSPPSSTGSCRSSLSSLTVDSMTKHRMAKFESQLGKTTRTGRKRCKVCYQNGKIVWSRFYCIDCGSCFCADGAGRGKQVRMCWSLHKSQQWKQDNGQGLHDEPSDAASP